MTVRLKVVALMWIDDYLFWAGSSLFDLGQSGSAPRFETNH
jgi:hypothetical protein